MKIKREEKMMVLIPESEWEYNQLKDLLYKPFKVDGFEDGWQELWNMNGGLVFKLKDPYDE